MEQLYLLEVFIEKIRVYVDESDDIPSKQKTVTAMIAFDPSLEFIIKEDQIVKNTSKPEDEEGSDELGPYFTRHVNVGKSIIFPSFPDTLMITLEMYPLHIEVWTDNEEEPVELIGTGYMKWDYAFLEMIKTTKDNGFRVTPVTKKAEIPLRAECCCKTCVKVYAIIRLTTIGNQVTSDFQQLFNDPQDYVFRNDVHPSIHKCRKLEEGDKEYNVTKDFYTPVEIEEPPKEVCTDMENCNVEVESSCQHDEQEEDKKTSKYPIDKIKIGDIRGPCGNADCEMAQRVKRYIRSLDTYKQAAREAAKNRPEEQKERKEKKTKKICGKCDCVDDRFHSDAYEKRTGLEEDRLVICVECGGFTKKGETCKTKLKKICGEEPEEEKKKEVQKKEEPKKEEPKKGEPKKGEPKKGDQKKEKVKEEPIK